MGIASMVIGIISVVLAFIPCPSAVLLFVPVLVGFIFGIVDVVQKSRRQEPKGCGIAGIVMNAIALLIILIWCFFFGAAATGAATAVGAALEKEAAGTATTKIVSEA